MNLLLYFHLCSREKLVACCFCGYRCWAAWLDPVPEALCAAYCAEVLRPGAVERGVEGHPADSLVGSSVSIWTVDVSAQYSLRQTTARRRRKEISGGL